MSMSNDELNKYMNEHINKLDIKMKEMLNNKIYNINDYEKYMKIIVKNGMINL